MKKSHSEIEKNDKFAVGDEVLVTQGLRKMRASVVGLAGDIGMPKVLVVEDNDGKTFAVHIDVCEKICENCDGAGVLVTPAKQEAGTIIDESEEDCKSCGGTGIL